MKISKITKILPLALAFALATTGAYAESAAGETTEATNNSQTINYSLDLQPFLDIETVTANTQTSSNTSFSGNYTGITIDTPLKGEFQVIGNQTTQSVALTATCQAGGAAQDALYNVSGDGGGLRIIFTNNTNAADANDLTTMKTSYTTASSPNAIAFTVSPTFKHEETPTAGFLNTPALSDGKIVYEVANGKHTFTYTIGTTAADSSFSTLDTNGTYKATLTMSSYTATP